MAVVVNPGLDRSGNLHYIIHEVVKKQTEIYPPTASARISACLVDISSWMTAHQLKLNPSKTELLVIPVVGCIRDGQDSEYRGLLDNFVDWCTRNYLFLNAVKTKEMVVDFRTTKTLIEPITIMDKEIEIVDNYKYLGVHLNNRMDERTHADTVYKKGISRLFFLRKLISFNVCNKMLEIFYQSVVASAIYCIVVCWGGQYHCHGCQQD
ncbi:hypothetical protein QTP86_002670 [Hemibagrus guttatus]|nr:hypothetical protein QTP86_002670 [Hemibagrus guttatus]